MRDIFLTRMVDVVSREYQWRRLVGKGFKGAPTLASLIGKGDNLVAGDLLVRDIDETTSGTESALLTRTSKRG